MLLRLWQAEQPRAVVVGWDTLVVRPTGTRRFEPYQSGREFDDAILEQLDLLPELVAAIGFVVGEGAGLRGRRLPRSRGARSGARRTSSSPPPTATPSSSRASDVTILQPVRGVSELARIGPAEVRERYGVEPEQVPDFIALRGDPSDKLPGARGVGAKTAATLLAQYGTLDAVLAAGRFAAEAEDLRLYRRIATMDASAPLRPSPTQPRLGGGVLVAEGSGLGELAGRARGAAADRRPDSIPRSRACTRPAITPSGPSGSRCCSTHSARLERGPRRRRPRRSSAATRAEHVARIRAIDEPTSGSTATRSARRRPARRRCSRRAGDRGGAARRLRARPPARPPRARRPRDGLLLLQQRRRRGPRRAGASSGSSASRSSTGTSITATAREAIFRDDDSVLFVSLHQWPFYPGSGGPGRAGARRPSTSRCAAGLGRRGVRRGVRATIVEPAVRSVRARPADRLGRLRRARRRPARRHAGHRGRVPRARPPLPRLAPRVAAVLEGGYNLETLPGLVDAALDGFSS